MYDIIKKRKPILFVISLFLCALKSFAQVDEPTIKAVAFEKVSRFIRWPDNVNNPVSEKRFIVGLIGNNDVTERAEELYKYQNIQGKPVEIRHVNQPEDALNCNLVYITSANKHTLDEVQELVSDKPILTICDFPGASQTGILMNLTIKQYRLRLEINEIGFHQAGLRIDPLLLDVADNVNPRRNIK